MKEISRIQRQVAIALSVGALLMLGQASLATARYTVSPQQEANFQRMSQEMGALGTPAGDNLRELYVRAHMAMKRNEAGRYKLLVRQMEGAYHAVPVSERRRLESVQAALPRIESAPTGPGVECTATCDGGSCTGTGTCTCLPNGTPFCTDAAGAALPPWAPVGIAGLLLSRAAWLRSRRMKAH